MRRADSFLSDAASGGGEEEVLFGAREIFFFWFLCNKYPTRTRAWTSGPELGPEKREPSINGLAP